MVAAHNRDLEAASACGMRCAFVARPLEFSQQGEPNMAASREWDFIAQDFADLARQLGC